MRAEESLRGGQVSEALAQLQAEVRSDPANAKLRIFLFQLLAVTAQWSRAYAQLETLREIDASALPMVHVYREAVQCELLREEVFAGRRSPLVLGDPDPWIARLIDALRVDAEGHAAEAARLRAEAFETAESSRGSLDGKGFDWIADGDTRLGPVLEAIVNGRYYWVPFRRIGRMVLEAPTDLRDLVWMPARFVWNNGGEAVGLIPARYPGVTPDDDPQLLLARRTEWESPAPDVYIGRGQRSLVTDGDERPLLEARELVLANEAPAPGEPLA